MEVSRTGRSKKRDCAIRVRRRFALFGASELESREISILRPANPPVRSRWMRMY